MLQFAPEPDRAHQAAGRVGVGSEQQMPDFMRDGEPQHHRRIGPGLRREPVDAIDVHGRKLPLADSRIHERISELELAAGGRHTGQADEPDREFGAFERDVARQRIGGRRIVSTM
jgi:hypothetical protein